MNYFEKLEEVTIKSGKLTAYIDDLYKYDKEELEGYEGEFVFGFRTSGTNIYVMDINKLWKDYLGLSMHDIQRCLENKKIYVTFANEWFYHGKDGVIKKVTKEKSIEIIDSYNKSIIAGVFEKARIKIHSIDTRLGHYADETGKRVRLNQYNGCWSWEKTNREIQNYELVSNYGGK